MSDKRKPLYDLVRSWVAHGVSVDDMAERKIASIGNQTTVGAFTPPINYFRANGFSLSPPKSKLKTDIEVPGLYIFGEHDDHLVFDHLWAAQNRIKNLKVQMVKGASHYAQQDDPERVNTLIRDFLKIRQPKVEEPVATSA